MIQIELIIFLVFYFGILFVYYLKLFGVFDKTEHRGNVKVTYTSDDDVIVKFYSFQDYEQDKHIDYICDSKILINYKISYIEII